MGSVSLHLQETFKIRGTYTWDASALMQPLTKNYVEKGWCSASVHSGIWNLIVAYGLSHSNEQFNFLIITITEPNPFFFFYY